MKEQSRFISLMSDYGFKATFANKENTLFLRRALKALLNYKHEIESVKFLSGEFIGTTIEARSGLYDLVCEDENGNTFIVEMQKGYYPNFINRSKFYAFHKYNTLVEKGDFKFDNISKIYCIGFLEKSIFKNSELYYHYGTLKNQYAEEMDDQMMHIIVEIDKFDKREEELTTDLDKLIYVMKNLEHIKGLDELPKTIDEDWLKIAIEKVDQNAMTPDQRMHWAFLLAKVGSKIEMEEAEKRRRDEKVTKANTIEIAKSLKIDGFPNYAIAKATGLTEEEINQL